MLLPFVAKHHTVPLSFPAFKIHFVRAFCWAMASALFFYSTTIISIPRAIAISFAVPLFTTVMAVIFLKEQLHAARIASLMAGFVGMLVIIQPGMDGFEMASLLVVAAAFLWSITDIIIKLLSKEHHAIVNTFYFAAFSALCLLPLAFFFWKTPSLANMGWLLALGFVFVLNIYSVTKAYEYADLTIMMPFAFSQLIFVAALTYFVFGTVIQLPTAIGSAIIVASTSFIAYREKKRHGKFLAPEIGKELYHD